MNVVTSGLIFLTFMISHIPLSHTYLSSSFYFVISIVEAKNGEEAFQKVLDATTSFALIVTDIQMPICDGFEFTRKVRNCWLKLGMTNL